MVKIRIIVPYTIFGIHIGYSLSTVGFVSIEFVFHLLFSYTLTFSIDNIPITVIKNPTKI